MPAQDREGLVAHVGEAVVEREPDGALGQRAGIEQLDRGHEVEDAIALGREVIHLLAEASRRDGERIGVVRDPVIEQDAQPVGT